MTNPPRRTAALVLAFLSSAGLVAQKGGGGAELTVSVTVAPICTVAITSGESSADRDIDVRCRNLAVSQPQPVITQAPIETTEDGVTDTASDVTMVVINF